MKRLQKTLLDLLGSMGRMKVKGLPRALVITIMLLIIGSIFLYLAAWSWQWWAKDHVDLPALNMLIQTITSMAFVAAIGFIGKSLIDAYGDGVPDPWEKEVKEEHEKSDVKRHPEAG